MAEKSGGASFGPFFILLLFIIVLAAIGGSTGPGGRSGSYVAPTESEEIQRELNRIEQDVGEIKKGQEKNALIGPHSPLFGKIDLYAGNVWSNNPDQEYVELTVGTNAGSRLLLTGLEIKSSISGGGAIIGKGVYRPEFSSSNLEDPIYVNPGDHIYLVSGKSPIGYSFRVNKCTGYFSQFHDFSPSLSFDCPRPADEGLPSVPLQWRNLCYNYIEGLPSCSMPLNFIPEDIGPECTAHVTSKINYDTCIDKHRLDFDFYKPEWRVYLNRPEELWNSRREFIKLLDQDKKTIDYEEIQ